MSPINEARFEQYLLEHELATRQEVKDARRILNQAAMRGEDLTIADAFVQAGCITRNQARRVVNALKKETVSPAIHIPGVDLMEKIGRGSQAVVYKGRQVSMDRIVAVKIMAPETARDAAARERFLDEARAAARLSHNNIVQAYDAGEADGYVYFLMEMIDPPRTVADLMQEHGGPLEEGEAVRIILQVAEALAHAHSRGFIHRDVKPKNIMLTPDGTAKLADMGLARQIGEGTFEEIGKAFGTPYYIAPEQVVGNPDIDFRADIYSLGASFYEMLAGRPPFTAKTPQQIMQKHVKAQLVPPDHVNPDLSSGVSEVVELMMSKRPEDRYRRTDNLLLDLRSIAAGQPPRIARERVGTQLDLMANLAQGQSAGRTEDGRPIIAEDRPFAVNHLVIIVLIFLALSLLVNVLLLVF
jgi:serine/threonine-protein kinase